MGTHGSPGTPSEARGLSPTRPSRQPGERPVVPARQQDDAFQVSGRVPGWSLGFLWSPALEMVKSCETLEYSARILAISVSLESSNSVCVSAHHDLRPLVSDELTGDLMDHPHEVQRASDMQPTALAAAQPAAAVLPLSVRTMVRLAIGV